MELNATRNAKHQTVLVLSSIFLVEAVPSIVTIFYGIVLGYRAAGITVHSEHPESVGGRDLYHNFHDFQPTMTDIYADEGYNPSFQVISAPPISISATTNHTETQCSNSTKP
jgi:hypothetical protein